MPELSWGEIEDMKERLASKDAFGIILNKWADSVGMPKPNKPTELGDESESEQE